jgi:hypothetical protein
MEDLGDDTVQQLEVVADDEHGPREARQLPREPALGGEIEMVGGLVQYQGVRTAEEHPYDVDPPTLAPRQRVDVVEKDVLAEPDPLGQPGDLSLDVVSPCQPVALFQVGEGGDCLRRRVGRHGPLGPVQLLVQHVETPGREHVGEPAALETEAPGRRYLG